MVVADAIFEQCRGVDGLNASRKTFFDERVERVVYRLTGNTSQLLASNLSCLIGGDMRVIANGL